MFSVLTTSLTPFYSAVIAEQSILCFQQSFQSLVYFIIISCLLEHKTQQLIEQMAEVRVSVFKRCMTMKKNECHLYCVLISLVWHNWIYFYKLIVFLSFYFSRRDNQRFCRVLWIFRFINLLYFHYHINSYVWWKLCYI